MFGFRRRRKPDVEAMIRRADALRDSRAYTAAAEAYGAILPIARDRTDLIVQYGNMLKDAGHLAAAAVAYHEALVYLPHDADLHVQLGHLKKISGDADGARNFYRMALTLSPNNADAADELRRIGDVQGLSAGLDPSLAAALLARTMAPEAAIPPAFWPEFRTVWDIPAPPPSGVTVQVVIAGKDGGPPAREQIESISAQSHDLWECAVLEPVGADLQTAMSMDTRFRTGDARDTIPLTLFCLRGERLHKYALGWLAFAAATCRANGFTADSETLDQSGAPASAVLRNLADPYAIGAGGDDGGAVALGPREVGEVIRALPLQRELVLADIRLRLAAKGALGHIPYPLTACSSAPRTSRRIHFLAGTLRQLSIIVPTRDNGSDAEDFVNSLRKTADRPQDFETVVIDNGSIEGATLASLSRLANSDRCKVVRIDEPFNWARLNNSAAAEAEGDILVFANDDMVMLSRGWDASLRSRLDDHAIGAVGARLIYPNGRIQHAGILAAWQDGFIHDCLDADPGEPEMEERWNLPRLVSAVTGAFIAVRRRDFSRLGGFDEARFAVSYNDVDFCYRMRESGLAVLFEPAIELTHHESKSRGRDSDDPVRAARTKAEWAAFRNIWSTPSVDPSANPFWADFGRPTRLLAPPDPTVVLQYIETCGSGSPWKPKRAG